MAHMDLFSDDAFSLLELTAALEDVEYMPNLLGTLNIFTPRSVRTEKISIERREKVLALVQSTPRGAPLPQLSVSPRDIRDFRSVRVAKGDTINASEIQGIRQFGTESELQQVQTEVLDRMTRIRDDIELTLEHMRLGAIQGLLLDADGSTIYNWFDEWDIAQPAEISFDFATLIDGNLRKQCASIVRTMIRAAKGAWSPASRVMALCGDNFYDALTGSKEVRETYLGWTAAADLRAANGQPFAAFPFGEILWQNYRGTDDTTKVAVDTNKVKFFPVNAPGAFLRVNSPGEFFDTVNEPGREFYALTIPDRDRNAFVTVEVYAYPLFIATRPAMLLRGKLAGT